MLELALLVRTGKLNRPVDDYPETIAYNLMFHQDRLIKAQEEFIDELAEREGDVVRSTGDPVADEWERQLARGELPDWMKHGGN